MTHWYFIRAERLTLVVLADCKLSVRTGGSWMDCAFIVDALLGVMTVLYDLIWMVVMYGRGITL